MEPQEGLAPNRLTELEVELETSQRARVQLEALFENTDDFIAFFDRDARLLLFNSAYGRTVKDIVGVDLRPGDRPADLLAPPQKTQMESYQRRVLGGEKFQVEYAQPTADGELRYFEVSYNPVRAEDEIVGFSQFSREITQHKLDKATLRRANEELEELVAQRTSELARSERTFRALTENNTDVTVVFDPEGTLTYMSSAVTQVFGYSAEEVIGQRTAGFVHPDDLERFQAAVADAVREPGLTRTIPPLRARHRDGEWRHVEVRITAMDDPETIVGVVLHARDVSPRVRAQEAQRRLEAQVLRAQKLESLGVLAAGIAHDFNNLLMGVQMNAELLRESLSDLSPRDTLSLELIKEAAWQAAELTNQLLTYAGKSATRREHVMLDALVADMARLLKGSIAKKARLDLELSEDCPHVLADAGQLRQVVMNLVLNASEALGEEQGTITVRSDCVERSATELEPYRLAEALAPGRYLRLSVSDTGCGMDAATAQRVFDPFFSTKFAGRGLGLATVRGVLHSHGGGVRLESQPGASTTITVLFPITASAQQAPGELANHHRAWRGEGLVLLVDDEPQVRQVSESALRYLGFDVITARDGAEALALFRARESELACVVLDLMMPVMGGEEVLRAVRRESELPVILSSGYTEGVSRQRLLDGLSAGFLKKPYGVEELRAALREALR